MKKLFAALLIFPALAFGQATTGFHRVSQVIARAPLNSVTAQVVPYATIVLTSTASGTAAAVYSDPLLSVGIPNSTLTADGSGNYDYYFALSYCVTETIMTPEGGITVIPNICSNGGGGGGSGCLSSGAAGVLQASDGVGGCEPAFVEVNGGILASPIAPNFVDTATVHVDNPGTNHIAFSIIPGTNLSLSTNSTPNISQALLNFTDTATVLFTNPSGGIESATVPTATSSTLGVVKPDNTTITVSAGVLSATSAASNTTDFKHAGSLLTGLFQPVAQVQTYDYDETAIAPDTNYVVATGRFNTGTGKFNYEVPTPASLFQMQVIPPDTHHGVFIPFTTCGFVNTDPLGLITVEQCDGQSGAIKTDPGGLIGHNVTAGIHWSVPKALSIYGINPANVIAVYGASTAWASSSINYSVYDCTGGSNFPTGTPLTSVTTILSGVNGTNFGSTVCDVSFVQSVPGSQGVNFQTQQIGLWVEDDVDTILSPSILKIGPNLQYNSFSNTLTTSQFAPNFIYSIQVASLPSADSLINVEGVGGKPQLYLVNDLSSPVVGSPAVGGGSVGGWVANNGAIWIVEETLPNSGGSGGFPIVLGSTSIAANSTTTSVAGLTVNGVTLNGAGSSSLFLNQAGGYTTPAGGGSVSVNGTSVSSPNFNDTTPAAGANGLNVVWQHSGSSVSAEIVGDGNSAHFLNGIGTFSTPAGGGGGGYANVTGSASETTVALINTACGSGTYYATTPLSIATGGTVTCPMQFSKAGLLTIASGQTVTFAQPVTETDGPNQHFAGSGTVVLGTNTTNPFVDWFGAVVFSTQAGAVAGTDSTTPIQACLNALKVGQCHLQSGYYKITSALSIAKSSVGLAGALSYGNSSNPSPGFLSAPLPSGIVTTSASADMIDVAGSSTSLIIAGNKFNDFSLYRSTAPTATASGISLSFAWGTEVNRVWVEDSVYGIHAIYADFVGSGGINNVSVVWGFNGFSETTGTFCGIFADGTAGGDISMNVNYANLSADAAVTAVTNGVCATSGVTDLMMDNLQTFQLAYGVHITGGTGSQDVHFLNSIIDSSKTAGIFVSGIGQNTTFSGGWVNSASGNYGIDIESSQGVTVTGMQVFQSGSLASIYLHNSGTSNVSNNNIIPASSSVGILVDGAQAAITGNNIYGNFTTPSTLIKFINTSVKSTVQSNLLATAATGISADATSSNNLYFNFNSIDSGTVTTPISDAGTGNQFTGGIAWGAITGTLSSQTDLQTALNLKAPLASPTFTGTPAAPTATGGTSTTQLATTAFVQAAIAAGGSNPLTFIQEQQYLFANLASFAITFPHTAQSSGATLFLLITGDGSGSFACPTSWTQDLKVVAAISSFQLCHIASASQTSATFTSANASPVAWFFEVSGSRTLDTSSTNNTGSTNYAAPIFPGAITPTAGAAMFSVLAVTLPSTTPATPLLIPNMAPNWMPISDAVYGVNGGRGIAGYMSTVAATNVSTNCPMVSLNNVTSYFASSGVAYGCFSIK